MEASGATAYLVNTGWNGTGERISIKDTRAIIDAILSGEIDDAETIEVPVFKLAVPVSLSGVSDGILDPRQTYSDSGEWDKKANDLAAQFIENFVRYTDTSEGKALVAAGPQL